MISKQKWMDDHLDLYLYAKNINDFEWAEQIVKKLKNTDQLYLQEVIIKERLTLWDQFIEINEQILNLYKEIREEKPSINQKESVFQEIMFLRALRIQLLDKINEYNKKEKETLA